MNLRTLTIAALLTLAVACGGDAETARTVPTATATSEPTVQIAPTPTALPISARSVTQWIVLGLGELREFPAELEVESEPLSRTRVEALWTDFLSGTRLVNNASGEQIFDFCSDQTGLHLEWFENQYAEYVSEPFTWSVRKDPGGRWNAVRIEIVTDVESLNPPPEQGPLTWVMQREGNEFVTAFGGVERENSIVPVEGGVELFFENPTCGQ